MLLFFAKVVVVGINAYLSVNLLRWSYKQAKKDLRCMKEKIKARLPQIEYKEVTRKVGETIEEKKAAIVDALPEDTGRGTSSLQAQAERMGVAQA